MSPAPRSELPIAVFDFGVGGLTVVHECLVSLPHEDFVYLGDTARFRYGRRSQRELRGFALELAATQLPLGEVRHVDVVSAGPREAHEASRSRRAAA